MLGKKPPFIKNDTMPKMFDNGVSCLADKNRIPEYATFAEWKQRGYSVMKGEKSYQKQDGVALFHKDQVDVTPYRYSDDDCDEFGGFPSSDDDWWWDLFH
jgi:hypothetical protein